MRSRPTRTTAVAVAACLILSQPEWRALAQGAGPADRVAVEARATPWGELADPESNTNEAPSALPVTGPRTLRASVSAILTASPASNVQYTRSSRAAAGTSRSRALKWILIGAAIAGGVIVAVVLAKNGDEGGGPVVTVGEPIVGAP
jgi:hypothetical protein